MARLKENSDVSSIGSVDDVVRKVAIGPIARMDRDWKGNPAVTSSRAPSGPVLLLSARASSDAEYDLCFMVPKEKIAERPH